MRFRPCIDLHEGQVKQIVGTSLRDGSVPQTHFIAPHPPDYFAERYRNDQLFGGHVIMLGPGNEDAAAQALAAFPGGLQVGGGIRPGNAAVWLSRGASQVIVTSYVFSDGQLHRNRLAQMVAAVGRDQLVLDLSCSNRDGRYVVMTDRWQKGHGLCYQRGQLGTPRRILQRIPHSRHRGRGQAARDRCRTRRALGRDRAHPDDVCRRRDQSGRHRHYRPSGPRKIGFYGGSGAGIFLGYGAALRGYVGIPRGGRGQPSRLVELDGVSLRPIRRARLRQGANEVAVRLVAGQKDRREQVILTGVELAISH